MKSELYQEFIATSKRIGLDLEAATGQYSLDLYSTLSESGKIMKDTSILDYLEQKNFTDWKMSTFKEFAKSIYDWIEYLGKQQASKSRVFEFASGESITVVHSPGLVKLCIRVFDVDSEDYIELHEEFTPIQLGQEELSEWSQLRSALTYLIANQEEDRERLSQVIANLEVVISDKDDELEDYQLTLATSDIDHSYEVEELLAQIRDLEEEVLEDDTRHKQLMTRVESLDRKLKKSIEVANAFEMSYLANLKKLEEQKAKNRELDIALYELTESEKFFSLQTATLSKEVLDLKVSHESSQRDNLDKLRLRDLECKELSTKLLESTGVAQLMKDMYEHTQSKLEEAEDKLRMQEEELKHLTFRVKDLQGANEKLQLDANFIESTVDDLDTALDKLTDLNFELESEVEGLRLKLETARVRESNALGQLAETKKSLHSRDVELYHTRRVLRQSAWRRTVRKKAKKLGLDSIYRKTFDEKEVGDNRSEITPSNFPGKEVARKLLTSSTDNRVVRESEKSASFIKISNCSYDPRLSGLLLKSVMKILTRVLDAKEADDDPKMDLSLEGSEKEVVERYRNRWRFLLSCLNRSSTKSED